MTEIKIVCKARSHQRRPQIIARFRDVGEGRWITETPVSRGVARRRFEEMDNPPRRGDAKFQLLDGDEPSDGGQHPANSGYRVRYRFECGMCGDVKVERDENLFDKFNRLRDARPDNDKHVIPLHIL